MSKNTHMNDTDFTYLYFLSFECLNRFYSTQMDCPRRDCCSFKEEYTEAWKDGGKNVKILSNDIHWLIALGKFRLSSLVTYILHKFKITVDCFVRSLKGILFYLFYFPRVLNEKPLHPFINMTKGMFLN